MALSRHDRRSAFLAGVSTTFDLTGSLSLHGDPKNSSALAAVRTARRTVDSVRYRTASAKITKKK